MLRSVYNKEKLLEILGDKEIECASVQLNAYWCRFCNVWKRKADSTLVNMKPRTLAELCVERNLLNCKSLIMKSLLKLDDCNEETGLDEFEEWDHWRLMMREMYRYRSMQIRIGSGEYDVENIYLGHLLDIIQYYYGALRPVDCKALADLVEWMDTDNDYRDINKNVFKISTSCQCRCLSIRYVTMCLACTVHYKIISAYDLSYDNCHYMCCNQ